MGYLAWAAYTPNGKKKNAIRGHPMALKLSITRRVESVRLITLQLESKTGHLAIGSRYFQKNSAANSKFSSEKCNK